MHGKRSGRLSGPSLHRLVTNDERVYFQNKESRTRDSAVQLVIDISGSMRGQKIHLAAQVAWALTEVLDRLKVSCEVICFTQTGTYDAENKDKHLYNHMSKDRRACEKFTRFGPIYMPILKSWDDCHFTQIHKRHFTRVAKSQLEMGGNVDGESLQYAGLRLLARPEPGKVMIVLSDGQPSGDGTDLAFSAHLKEVVRDLTRSGVNVMGIGICDASVRNYYPKHVVVNKVEDLAGVVMGKVRDALLKS
jgi:cobalamin biosynthesis protein CobT